MAYGKQNLPKKQKQKAIYPYGPSMGTGEMANSKRKAKGKDVAAACPNCGAYGQFANAGKKMRGTKLGKNISREVNKGPAGDGGKY